MMIGSIHPIDLGVVIIANLMNLLLTGMFLARASGMPRLARSVGSVVLLLAVPLALAAALNILWQRDWWLVILPALVVLWCAVEFALDYTLKIDFRRMPLLWPYLALYYVSLMGMIGYAFMAGKPLGFATLVTYFANLGATFYSLARVRHAV
jgi:hypothetical protein